MNFSNNNHNSNQNSNHYLNTHSSITYENLNHPWFIYPRAFMSEYNDYDLYRSESIRLEKFLNNFLNDLENRNFRESKLLIPIILGSTMEDSLINSYTEHTNIFQYQQLFPCHIDNYIENIDGQKYIQIIIISPDRIFSDHNYIPLFIKLSKYTFNKINQYEFISINNSFTIKVNIFNCPMVSEEKRFKTIEKCDYILNNLKNLNYNLKTYKQNNNDLLLIKTIYQHLKNIFNFKETNHLFSNEILITINSWVSFKNLDGYAENYKMFPELLSLASEYNIIATEWEYKDDCFISIIKSNYHFGNNSYIFKKIIYANYNSELISVDKVIKFIKSSNSDIFIIDFKELDLLKKIEIIDV